MDISEIKIGDVVSFKSLNTTDPNIYVGKVKGEVTYDIAKSSMDVKGYNNSVSTITGIITPVDQLIFFVLKLYDKSEMVYFAKQWINESTLKVIQKYGSIITEILDVNETDIAHITDILASEGYTINIISFKSSIEI